MVGRRRSDREATRLFQNAEVHVPHSGPRGEGRSGRLGREVHNHSNLASKVPRCDSPQPTGASDWAHVSQLPRSEDGSPHNARTHTTPPTIQWNAKPVFRGRIATVQAVLVPARSPHDALSLSVRFLEPSLPRRGGLPSFRDLGSKLAKASSVRFQDSGLESFSPRELDDISGSHFPPNRSLSGS